MAKKILLADDSVTMQKVFQMTFAAEDFAITAVSRGEEAINWAKTVRPDIVIADLSMDGKNGYDICAELKADPSLAAVPFLLLHGSGSKYDEAKARSAKADGEITKPFESQDLISKVKTLLESAAISVREPIGPIQSLAPPIESRSAADVTFSSRPLPPVAAAKPATGVAVPKGTRTELGSKPLAAKAPAPQPKPPVSSSMPSPSMPAATSSQPAAAAVATKPATPPPPRPAAPIPTTPPPRPMVTPPKPIMAPAPARPITSPSTPAAPGRKIIPPVAPRREFPEEVEIVIEAEPPSMDYHESLPSFDSFQPPEEASPFAATAQDRLQATMLGFGKPDLPTPPAGMPLPPMALPPAILGGSVPATPAQPPGAVKSTGLASSVQPTDHYDPAAYNAIAKLSREIIERIVWEVVPDLAERIIREELDRLVEKRRSG